MSIPMNHLKEDTERQLRRCKTILGLIERFPTLNMATDRWNRSHLYTDEVNTICDKVWIGRSCGCCEDADLVARPYVEIEGEKIYGNPGRYTLGTTFYEKITPTDKWRENMRTSGIPHVVIEQVEEWLAKNVEREERPNLSDPCPHPARNGNHEIYMDGVDRMVCRACGARGPCKMGEDDG